MKVFFVGQVGKDRHASFLIFILTIFRTKIYFTIGERGSVKSIFFIFEFSGSTTKALYTFSFRSISVSDPQITISERFPSAILKLIFSGEIAVKAEVRVENSVGNLVNNLIAAKPLLASLAKTEGSFDLNPPGNSNRFPDASMS